MDKVRGYVKQQEEQIGRPLTFYVKTFGCQMNARDSEKLVGILENCLLYTSRVHQPKRKLTARLLSKQRQKKEGINNEYIKSFIINCCSICDCK